MEKSILSFNFNEILGTSFEDGENESFSWGSNITDDIKLWSGKDFKNQLQEFIDTKSATEALEFYSKNKLDFIRQISSILNTEREWYTQFNNAIKFEFSISSNGSIRFLRIDNKLVSQFRKNVVIDIGIFDSDEVILVDSVDLNIYNLSSLTRFFLSLRNRILHIFKTPKSELIPLFENIYFTSFPSSIITHEVFGHLFEEDNFAELEDKEIKIPMFISVVDNPSAGLCGDCSFDDEGNFIEPITVTKNGQIMNLLGSNYFNNRNILNTRSRLGLGGAASLPRVTNTILTSSLNYTTHSLNKTLIVDSLNYARYRKGNILLKNVSARYIRNNTEYGLYNLSIAISAKDFIENIIYTVGKNRFYSSTKGCIKKSQSHLAVGFSSPGLVISITKCKSFQITLN